MQLKCNSVTLFMKRLTGKIYMRPVANSLIACEFSTNENNVSNDLKLVNQ